MTKQAKSQSEKFKEAARQLETDDSEEAFDRALKKVATTKPSHRDGTHSKETKK